MTSVAGTETWGGQCGQPHKHIQTHSNSTQNTSPLRGARKQERRKKDTGAGRIQSTYPPALPNHANAQLFMTAVTSLRSLKPRSTKTFVRYAIRCSCLAHVCLCPAVCCCDLWLLCDGCLCCLLCSGVICAAPTTNSSLCSYISARSSHPRPLLTCGLRPSKFATRTWQA